MPASVFPRQLFWLTLLFCALCGIPGLRAADPSPAAAQPATEVAKEPTVISPLGPIPAEATGPHIDPGAATRAYLATFSGEARARSDAYFEGGYWLLLWNALLAVGINLLILTTRWSAAWRDRAVRISSRHWLQVAIYAALYFVVTSLLSFPMALYQTFFREHQYHMSNQTIGAWLGDQAKGEIVGLIGLILFLLLLYWVFRRQPRTWWIWGSAVSIFFLSVGVVIIPIAVEPLFNDYQKLTNPAVRDPILTMARANQIPVDNVYWFDASRQTTQVSANVAGGFGTARIALNDNLLNKCSLPEIRQVMAHEMGHYVLNHIYKILLETAVTAILAFGLLSVLFNAVTRRYGTRWGITGIADPAGFPLIILIFTVLGLLYTPISNSLSREIEAEADAFGINTAREPDGFAQASLKLGEYRKLDPGPLEEFVFFDHPSGRARIRMAMEWKAAHLPEGTK